MRRTQQGIKIVAILCSYGFSKSGQLFTIVGDKLKQYGPSTLQTLEAKVKAESMYKSMENVRVEDRKDRLDY